MIDTEICKGRHITNSTDITIIAHLYFGNDAFIFGSRAHLERQKTSKRVDLASGFGTSIN